MVVMIFSGFFKNDSLYRDVGVIPKTNIVEQKPTEELMNRNRLEPPPMQVMYIMADLSPKERYDGSKGRMSRHFMKQSTCSPLPMYIPSTVDVQFHQIDISSFFDGALTSHDALL